MHISVPMVYVLFGSTGDLAQKKIVPALLALFSDGRVNKDFLIIAFSRRKWTDQEYRNFIKPALESNKSIPVKVLEDFLAHITYTEGTFEDKEAFNKIKEKITEFSNSGDLKDQEMQVIYHLAVRPDAYAVVSGNIGSTGLDFKKNKNIKAKLLIEKPFGHDAKTAAVLEAKLDKCFNDEQIFRIDHYLAKLGLQDLIATRKADHALESTLNNTYVESIIVRMHEKIDIEGRGEFYDTVGALRDTGQNHVLEMLASFAMDLDTPVHVNRAEVLSALKLITPETASKHVTVGQYESYLKEKDVPTGSRTETYFKVITEIENERWKGVEVILESGKGMKEKRNEVEVNFKDSSKKVFDIEKGSKKDAYEILIEKAFINDEDYFVGKDEIEASWKFIDSIRNNLDKLELKIYKKGEI